MLTQFARRVDAQSWKLPPKLEFHDLRWYNPPVFSTLIEKAAHHLVREAIRYGSSTTHIRLLKGARRGSAKSLRNQVGVIGRMVV